MTLFNEAIQRWPTPSVPSLPVQIEKGRRFGPFHNTDLESFVGQLFKNSDAQAVRATFTKTGPEFFEVTIDGAACPPVPYSTLSGEYLPSFLEFSCQRAVTLWLHSERWFWADGLDESELEKLTDSFIHSL